MQLTVTIGDPSAAISTTTPLFSSMSTSIGCIFDEDAIAFDAWAGRDGGGLRSSSLKPSAGSIDFFSGLPPLARLELPLSLPFCLATEVLSGALPVADDGVRSVVEAGEEELGAGLRGCDVAEVGGGPALGMPKKPIRVDCLDLYHERRVSASSLRSRTCSNAGKRGERLRNGRVLSKSHNSPLHVLRRVRLHHLWVPTPKETGSIRQSASCTTASRKSRAASNRLPDTCEG